MGGNEIIDMANNQKYTSDEENEILKLAAMQINLTVFVYDVTLERIYFLDNNIIPLGILNHVEYKIEDILAEKIFDSESMVLFKTLFDGMHRDKSQMGATIKVCSGKRQSWCHIQLKNCFNQDGHSVRAIGTIQDVSGRVETELRYTKEKQYRLAMLADSRRVYEINITQNRFTKLETIQDSTDYGKWDLYTESMYHLCKTRIYKGDWDIFLKVALRENLIKGFLEGITEYYCEYRVVFEDGRLEWSSSATHLLRDPVTEDIKGFIYIKDIDAQKKQEIELHKQSERDPLTGVYNRRGAEWLITDLLCSADLSHIHGFLNIDIDDFKYVNDTFGHMQGDLLLKQIASGINHILRTVDVFARMGGDEFIAFINDVGSVSHILDVGNRLCEYVSSISIGHESGYHPTISIGIAIYPRDGATLEELYRNSDQSLYDAKRQGKNSVSVYGHGEIEQMIHRLNGNLSND